MKTALQVFFQVQDDVGALLTLQKDVDYYVSPSMMITCDNLNDKVSKVTFNGQKYIAEMSSVINPSTNDWEKRLRIMLNNDWREVKRQ